MKVELRELKGLMKKEESFSTFTEISLDSLDIEDILQKNSSKK